MEKIKEDLCLMCDQAKEMLKLAHQGFKTHSLKKIEEAEEIGKKIRSQDEELTTYPI